MNLLSVSRVLCLAVVVLLSFSATVSESSPVAAAAAGGYGVTAEDMGIPDAKLDSKAMQGLLKKLWKYEAESWKTKYEAAESKSALLEQKVEALVAELRRCTGGTPDQTQLEGEWAEGPVNDANVKVNTENQGAEDDLRALASPADSQTERNSEMYDTEFIIIPMNARSLADSDDSYIRITSPQDDDVSVHVIEPRGSKDVAYRIPPHGVIQIPLNRIPDDDSNNIQLQTDQPVKVQVMAPGNSPAEGYNVVFVSSLGTEYTLEGDDNRFAIVSMADDTSVKVQDSTGNQLYSMLLSQGQTFLTPAGKGPSFAGGTISAQNPVAVFAVRPTQCNSSGCSTRTLQLLQPETVDRKAWNDCLISAAGCKKKRPRPG